MKRIFWFLLVISSLVGTTHEVSACAGGDEDWWQRPKYLFLSSFLSDTTYAAYFDSWPYYNRADNDNYVPLPDAIVAEWKSKFPRCAAVDIKAALFSLNEGVIMNLRNNQNPSGGNTFYQAVLGEGVIYIDYLDFVYRQNKIEAVVDGYWDDPKKDLDAAQSLIEEATSALKNLNSDAFLKQKYTYQLVKLYHYIGNHKSAVKAFDEYANVSEEKTLSYYRALGYKAGSLRFLGDSSQAKYLFAKIFDQSEPLRLMAYRNFKYINGALDGCLAYAKLNSEKSAIWMLQNVYDDQLDIVALQEMYLSDPASSRLELTMVKQMNIVHEEYLNKLRGVYTVDTNKIVKDVKLDDCNGSVNDIQTSTPSKGWLARLWDAIVNFFKSIFGSSDSGKNSRQGQGGGVHYDLKLPFVLDDEWVGEYVALLEKINREGKVKNKDLFKAALGYVYVVSGDFDKSKMILNDLTKSKDKPFSDLAEYLILWSELVSQETVTPEFEEYFVEFLQKNENKLDIDGQSRLSDLQRELTRRYLIEQEFNKAVLVYQKDYNSDIMEDFFTCAMLDSLQSYIKQQPITILEKHFKKPDAKVLEKIKIERLILMGRFEEALVLDPKYTFSVFNDQTKENQEGPRLAEVVEWLKKADAESYHNTAELIAHGTLWLYNQYPWGYWKGYSPSYGYGTTVQYPFNVSGLAEDYVNRSRSTDKRKNGTTLAESYYLKAQEKSNSDEFKAEMYFKAQTVKNKSMYGPDQEYDYYITLKDKYGHTQFYKETYNSCSFVRLGKLIYY